MHSSSGDLVRVYTATSITDGHLARGRIEAEGIPVLVKGEGEGPYRMGPVHLWVPDGFEVQARIILEAVRDGDAALGPADAAFADEISDEP